MKIGLWGTPQTEEGWTQVWELIGQLDARSVSAYGSPDLAEAFFTHQRKALSPHSIGALYSIGAEHLPLIADLLVVWGGRKALLSRLEVISAHTPTVLLVGQGEGFPAIGEEALTEAVGQLLKGSGVLDSRMLLGAELLHSEKKNPNVEGSGSEQVEEAASSKLDYVGAEEIVFQRSESDALLRIDLSINGRFLTSYEADGLVISTPTGSAARSLSAGGPLVVPGTGGLLVTPVASHTLTTRPMLVPKASTIEAQVQSRSGSAFFRADRSTRPLENDDVITIRREKSDLQLAVPSGKGSENFRKTRREAPSESTNSASEGAGKEPDRTSPLGLVPASTADRLRESVSFPRCRTARGPASAEDCLDDRIPPWPGG